MNTNDYIVLLHKKLTEQITPREQEVLAQWLHANPENRKLASEMEELWKVAGEQYEQNREAEEAHHVQQRDRLMTTIRNSSKLPQKSNQVPVKYERMAAALVFMLLGGWAITLYFTTDVHITASEKQTVWLTDSTQIVLNKNARLQMSPLPYPVTVGASGQAYFRAKAHAVTIRLQAGLLTAQEAAFFISSQPGYEEVIVTEGELQLITGNQITILSARQQAVLTETHTPVVSPVRNVNQMSWYSGVWQFQENTLAEITHMFRKEYHADFQFQDAALQRVSFTGTFINQDLESMLKQLSAALGFSYKHHQGTYQLKAAVKT